MQVVNIEALRRDYDKRAGEAGALLSKTAKECQAYEEKDDKGNVTVRGRAMTTEEKAAIQAIIDDATSIDKKIKAAQGESNLQAEIDRLTAGMSKSDAEVVNRDVRKSLGQQWVDSDAGKFFIKKMHHGSRNWNSPVAELWKPDLMATTLTEGAGSGGKLIIPDYRPGIQPLLFKRLTIRSLLASGSTSSTSIIYMVETTFTNAAATVAEGAVKPESALVFDQKTDPIVKIAHWIPVTEEMLEDVSQIRSYIDARLRLGVELTEEDQLLNGDGVLPNLLGIMNRPGLAPAVPVGAAPDNAIEAIFRQMMAIFYTSFVMPDGIVMNPANWSKIALTKDTTGQYMGGGPFQAAQTPTLWGLPIDVTPSIVANTALVGAFGTQAQVFDHGGMRVEASNSHQDFFIKNLVAIRAEQREGLAVYRPGAFGKVTALP